MSDPAAAAGPRSAPAWLARRIEAAGGRIPFRTYMDWVLHDPLHGAYGAGVLRIGPRGDFATAPSLSADFGELLAPQLAEWLELLLRAGDGAPVSLVEAGPGEGALALQLAGALVRDRPDLAARTELVLIEPNPGMADRQRQALAASPLPVRWSDFAALAGRPLRGVVLAHEVLDALAVERIVWDGGLWRHQAVALRAGQLRLEAAEPLESDHLAQLGRLGLAAAAAPLPAGWSSELHPGLAPWLRDCAGALGDGWLLVIDYALEARRYYAPSRSDGTLLAYRGQRCSADPLREPGLWDLTAHLCLESLAAAAAASGWRWLGQRRQGEALLALGLAGRLQGLRHEAGVREPAALLARREALLRLVDPAALGEFRWIALGRGDAAGGPPGPGQDPLFLRDPPPS